MGSRFHSRDEDEIGLDNGHGVLGTGRRTRSKGVKNKFPPVPSEAGRELMDSRIYGSHDHFVDSRKRRKTNLATRLLYRETGIDTRGSQKRANNLISQARATIRFCTSDC